MAAVFRRPWDCLGPYSSKLYLCLWPEKELLLGGKTQKVVTYTRWWEWGGLSPFSARSSVWGRILWGSIAGSRGWHAASGPSWHNSAEGNLPDADVGLCPRAPETLGPVWHEVTVRRTTVTSGTAPKLLGGVKKQGLMGKAEPWCCAHPQPRRSNLLKGS